MHPLLGNDIFKVFYFVCEIYSDVVVIHLKIHQFRLSGLLVLWCIGRILPCVAFARGHCTCLNIFPMLETHAKV